MVYVGIFLVTAFIASYQIDARPRRFYVVNHKANSLLRVFKSVRSSRAELFCPRDIKGNSFVVNPSKRMQGCGDVYNLCNDDADCEPGLKCCLSGCIYKCVVPQPMKKAIAIDWIKEPEALTVGGNSWLIDGDGTGDSPPIDCSTSEIPGVERTKCPTGFFCKIEDEGDESNELPNRGICLSNPAKESTDIPKFLMNDPVSLGSGCTLNGKEIAHGHHEVLDCKICFCKDSSLYCRIFPCYSKKTLGI